MSIIFYFLRNFRYTLTIKAKKRSAARGGNDMFRIWAKIMKEGKIQRQFVYENDEEKLTYSHFLQYLFDICRELDAPTPVLLKTHIFNFAKFNHVRFLPRDFVEAVDFDYLLLENIII